MAQITVRGTALRQLPPELGVLHIRIDFGGDYRTAVLEQAVHLQTEILAQVRSLIEAGNAVRVVAPSIHSWTDTDWSEPESEKGQRVTRYRSGAPIDVWFTDMDVLGAWIASLDSSEGVKIRGITWDLTEDTRSHLMRQIRMDATQDAITRAGQYATAAGLGDIQLVALWEVGLHHSGTHDIDLVANDVAEDGRPAMTPIELRPDSVEVRVVVTAEFEATPPDESSRPSRGM